MNLSAFAIQRSRIAITIFALVALSGLGTFFSLPQDSMPPFTIRVATVVTKFPGAAPERVEELVTKSIEQTVQEIPELDEVNSVSRSGVSIVSVSLRNDVPKRNLQSVWDRIRRKLEEVPLPEDASWELNDEGIGEVFGIMIGLLSDVDETGTPEFSFAEMEVLAEEIRDELITIDESAKVEIGGLQEEQVFIEYDNAKLAYYNISPAQIRGVLSSTNILYSGGAINIGPERIVLEPTGNFNSIDELKRTIIRSQGDQNLFLSDVASVHKGYASPAKQLIKVDGKPALALSVSLKAGANIVRMGEAVDQCVDRLNTELPLGIRLKRLASLDTYVDSEVANFVSNLVQTIVLVLIVMLIFLGLRTGLIIASLVPMVILSTFLAMGILGQGINQVTLASLIMALGLMVDNGVVVSETILVKLENGLSRWDAVLQTGQELAIPLLISTLTTAAAFLSFFLAQSVMGEIVGPLFVVISSALLLSWIFSMSLIPMLCYYYLKSSNRTKPSLIDRFIQYLKVRYERLLDVCLRRRWLTLSIIGIAFIGSLPLFGVIPFIFFPDSERNLITIDINLSQGTRVEQTDEVVATLESFLQESLLTQKKDGPGVLDWSAYIGRGPESYDLGYQQDEPSSNYAHMLVNTTDGDYNAYVISKLDSFCFQTFPTADIRISRLASGGGGVPIEIKIAGPDPAELSQLADQVKQRLFQESGTKNVKDNWGPRTKKIIIDINPLQAQRAGLTNEDIALSLNTALNGFRTGEYREGENSLTILMRDARFDTRKIEELGSVNIYSLQTGQNVPLSQVANTRVAYQYAKISREDLRRTITISSRLTESGNASKIIGKITPWLEEESNNWKPNYSYSLGGDNDNSAENIASVADWLPLCGMIILLLLIIQFNSFRKTIIIVSTIPLGIIGVAIGLLVLNSYFGFFAFLGIISLAGIIINNAIVLVDRIDIELATGSSLPDALREAAQQRFRPIMLTTFTTVLGMIPLYLGGGLMWEPLAATIMIGLLIGSFITLIFVPVFYRILYAGLQKKGVGKTEELT